MTLEILKAKAYDTLALLERLQKELQDLNYKIATYKPVEDVLAETPTEVAPENPDGETDK